MGTQYCSDIVAQELNTDTDAPVPSVSKGSLWVGRGPRVCQRQLSRCASQCVLTWRKRVHKSMKES
jgi:hypothetical protein